MSCQARNRYWMEVHGPLFASLDIAKANLLKYEQVCSSPTESSSRFAELVHKAHTNDQMLQSISKAGFKVAEWDGMAIFEAESYEKLMEIFTNEEFLKVVIPDAGKVMDASDLQFMPLDLITPVDAGKEQLLYSDSSNL
ncbi:hypothetical protein B0H19DRAFT_1129310 [Mycena capillaripes]|nr:hypothetical protein B0H19DRAFT_1129310 [Mycena capillaripes]